MPRSYVLAELAQAELEDILRYIAHRGDVDTALRVEDEFRIELRRLAENPLIGHHRSDIEVCDSRGSRYYSAESLERVQELATGAIAPERFDEVPVAHAR